MIQKTNPAWATLRVDLHIHTTASDGRWTPEQVIEQVKGTGIDLFAVADHDSVAHVRVVERLAKKSKLGFLRATEISTTVDGQSVHLVGYDIDPENQALVEMLDQNAQKLKQVNDQSIQTLLDAGYDREYGLDWDEYKRYTYNRTRGGWEALNYLIDKGVCSGVKDFFGRVFTGDLILTYPAFATPEQAIKTIKDAGGTAIWAHPGPLVKSDPTVYFEHMLAAGIQGMECYSPYHDIDMQNQCLSLCRERDLLITAGSDCHGGFAGRTIGKPAAFVKNLNLGALIEQAFERR